MIFYSENQQKMTGLMKQTFDKISQLSEEKQNALAAYLQKHMNDLLQKAEKEKRIEEGNYTLDDFNESTQQVINNIEENKNLTVCKNQAGGPAESTSLDTPSAYFVKLSRNRPASLAAVVS